MNQQKHTPGPWELHTSNSTDNVWIEDAESNCVIAPSYAFGINGIKDKQSMANARLIAAAPELLEAVKLAETFSAKIDRCLGAGFEDMDLDLAHQARSLQSKLQAAIAKALGE